MEAAQKACAGHFNKRARCYSIFRIGNWVYLDRPPAWEETTAKGTIEESSRKLASKKEGP